MDTRFIEAAHCKEGGNWGKFLVGRFTEEEWARRSVVEAHCGGDRSLLRGRGWSPNSIVVFDLQTGEGALFRPGGYAPADLNKHRVWVCPLFEPFLTWLYQQDLSDLSSLPDYVELPDAPFSMAGYRREGPPEASEVSSSPSS
jgi:hypothetical protein